MEMKIYSKLSLKSYQSIAKKHRSRKTNAQGLRDHNYNVDRNNTIIITSIINIKLY
jgi:hypothetical protein